MQQIDRDKELDEFIKRLDKKDIKVPIDLEERILNRIEGSSQKNHKDHKHFFYLRSIKIVAAVIVLFMVFVGSVKWSPGFAAYASNIPVVKNVVEWFAGDKGTEYAKEKGYENIEGIIFEKNGYKLIFNNIMIDEDRLIFSCIAQGDKISEVISENKNNFDEYPDVSFEILGFEHPGYHASNDISEYNNDVRMLVQKYFQEGELESFLSESPQFIQLEAKIWERGNVLLESFDDIKIPLEKDMIQFSNKHILDQRVDINHGSVLLDKLTISPTRMKLDINLDMDEGYYFTGFKGIYLKDDKGNRYNFPDGVTGTIYSSEARDIYFVPSIYFDESPESLYLILEGVWVGSEEYNSFTIAKDDKYPKEIEYMGEIITIGNVDYHYDEDGNKHIELTLNHSPEIRVGNLIVDGEHFSWSYTGDKPYLKTYSSKLVEDKSEYQISFYDSGYFYQMRTETKLDINFNK